MRTIIIMTMTDIAAAAVRIMTMKTMIMRSMSIIITTITMANAAARIMTMSTTITTMRSIIITTIMTMRAAARITTTSIIKTTMMSVAVAAMTMSITIIMQMRCSQAGDYTGKVCVIGANLKEDELKKAFGRNE